MFDKYRAFIRGIARDRLGKVGVMLTTSTFVTMLILELARLTGVISNTYVGLITYMILPPLFIIGLLIVPLAWRRMKRKTGMSSEQLRMQYLHMDEPRVGFFGSRLFQTIALLTLVNVFFLGAVSMRMLSFMDTPVFCGTACHSVMNPEWVTYQQSPHARVACVDCHVGEGAEALIDSKLNGLWQVISVTFDLLERPIPTPVHQLRPARETCEKCHWPEKFYGRRLKTIPSYAFDSASTPVFTTLVLKVDAGGAGQRSGIHWHVAAENEVRYASIDDQREDMLWVEMRQNDGSYRRFTNTGLTVPDTSDGVVRILDCVDCHNRATHIYEEPERAVDSRIYRGYLDRTLPYLKREALHAISSEYPGRQPANDGIANSFGEFYRRHYPEIARSRAGDIDSAIAVLQQVYARNIHPEMHIGWGAYPSHIGHGDDGGCFRCHSPDLVDANGSEISYDCTLCHSILADDQEDPFQFLISDDTTRPDYDMYQYLRGEFYTSFFR